MLRDNITHAEITTTDYIELDTEVQYTISQLGDFSPLVFFFHNHVKNIWLVNYALIWLIDFKSLDHGKN